MWEVLYIETPQTSTYYSWRENLNVIFARTRLPKKGNHTPVNRKSKNETKSQLSPE